MTIKRSYILIIIMLILLVIASIFAYIWFTGGSGEASTTISAPTQVVDDTSNLTVFRIDPEQSQVTFRIEEDLFGTRTTVIGTTDQIAGDIAIDFENIANTQLGTIRVNVRTLVTDEQFRNRSIRGQILLSAQDEFEFAEFVPTELIGLPQQAEIGETVEFTINGDLTLKGITQNVSFDSSVTLVSETEIEGTALAIVMREQFELTIPEAPGVANVAEEVELQIDFIALQVEVE